jgi:hypothetical protein
MRHLPLTGCLLAILLGVVPDQAVAWTQAIHREIAADALKISPRYVQLALGRYREDILAGAAGPRGEKAVRLNGAEQNYLDSKIPEQIEILAGQVRKLVRRPGNLKEVAYCFGLISHYTALAANPLNVENTDAQEVYYHALFGTYVEGELRNYRVAFSGYTPGIFEDLTVRDYLGTVTARAQRFYGPLSPHFTKGGKIASIEKFDHFSVPFAVASIAYGNAVNAVADVWRGAWLAASAGEKK